MNFTQKLILVELLDILIVQWLTIFYYPEFNPKNIPDSNI